MEVEEAPRNQLHTHQWSRPASAIWWWGSYCEGLSSNRLPQSTFTTWSNATTEPRIWWKFEEVLIPSVLDSPTSLLTLLKFHSGSLPSQLLLETLHSIHYILFPISEDHKSAKLVRSLIRKSKFDPDLLIHDGCIRALPENFEHVYWGNRLRIIQDMTSKPPPKNILVSWVERHTSERNALSVAILGLILVVVFGFLSLLVGVAQLIVSILAWKYPQWVSGCGIYPGRFETLLQ